MIHNIDIFDDEIFVCNHNSQQSKTTIQFTLLALALLSSPLRSLFSSAPAILCLLLTYSKQQIANMLFLR